MKESYAEHMRRQYDEDSGLAARIAVAHEKTAAELRNLPENLMATPAAPTYLFAMTGTAEERRAAVDAWAARHHVTAGWELGIGYSARVQNGPSAWLAMALPVVTDQQRSAAA
jgi:hypothetical protein